MPNIRKYKKIVRNDLKSSKSKYMVEEKPDQSMDMEDSTDMEENMDMEESMDMEENMMARKNLMIHLEIECGMEERPRPCVKIPISLDAAIIALIVSIIENC